MTDTSAAMQDLLASMDRAATTISAVQADATDAVEGQRFLTRLMSIMLDLHVENADPDRPHFTRVMTRERKFFGDTPDAYYDYAPVQPGQTYRISGTRGDTVYVAFTVYGGTPDMGKSRIVSHICDTDMDFADDGSFEITVSGEESPTGNHLRLEDDAYALVVRQYFADRPEDHEGRVEADLAIGVTGTVPPSPPIQDSPFADRLRRVGATVETVAALTSFVGAGLSQQPNEVTVNVDGALPVALFPTPDNHYVGGWFKLGPDEALVIEGEPVPCRFWSVQLLNRWMESLDYESHQVNLNVTTTELEPDGSFRFVVADRDPGAPNWLDTAGHSEGLIGFRWMNAETPPKSPTFTVVPLSELT